MEKHEIERIVGRRKVKDQFEYLIKWKVVILYVVISNLVHIDFYRDFQNLIIRGKHWTNWRLTSATVPIRWNLFENSTCWSMRGWKRKGKSAIAVLFLFQQKFLGRLPRLLNHLFVHQVKNQLRPQKLLHLKQLLLSLPFLWEWSLAYKSSWLISAQFPSLHRIRLYSNILVRFRVINNFLFVKFYYHSKIDGYGYWEVDKINIRSGTSRPRWQHMMFQKRVTLKLNNPAVLQDH